MRSYKLFIEYEKEFKIIVVTTHELVFPYVAVSCIQFHLMTFSYTPVDEVSYLLVGKEVGADVGQIVSLERVGGHPIQQQGSQNLIHFVIHSK